MKTGAKISYRVSFNGIDVTDLKLVKGVYSGNAKIGKAVLSIQPVGRYTRGSRSVISYVVTETNLSGNKIILNYVGGCKADARRAASKKMLVVKDDQNNVLKYGTDYTAQISDTSGTDGNVTVTVKGVTFIGQ